MMPVYRYTDSNPYQRNQTFCFPKSQGFRANSPVSHESWCYGDNYGYPMPFHSCCPHNSGGPGYNGFRPCYPPHASVPSPLPFYGGYPAPFYEPYPVHYVPPPPDYSMEIPKHKYDKTMPRGYHCCGCPNHHCHQNVDKGVKIEEQGPDVVEMKRPDDSLSPVQMKDYPYPIVWIPPESLNGREQRMAPEPEIIEDKEAVSDSRRNESLKSREGDQRHRWYNSGSLVQDGNRKPVRDQRLEDGKKEFSFPIFWMPSYEEAAKDKDMNASQDQQTEELKTQFPFPFFWLPYENKQGEEVRKEDIGEVNATPKTLSIDIPDGGSVAKKASVNEQKPAGQVAEERKNKIASQKIVPVEQVVTNEANKSEDPGRRGTAKNRDDNVASKPAGTSFRKQSLSPKKSSELPPVCLRIDPLPNKKDKGSSRSPSPPGPKAVKQHSPTDTTKPSASLGAHQDSMSQNCSSRNSTEVEQPGMGKVIEVVDKNITKNNDALHTSELPGISKVEAARKPNIGESENDVDRREISGGARKVVDIIADSVQENKQPAEIAKSVSDGIKLQRKPLSDVEAAVFIQSAYRGFEVRRWEPLKKLKQIAEVRDEVADVRNSITSLETSDLQKDDKQRVVIGETIMRLLLKLDTIQGLLPSLRDIRRSLARELVVLQEKLDDLITKKPQDPTPPAPSVKPVEEVGSNVDHNNCLLKQQKDEATAVVEGNADGGDSSQPSSAPCQGQVLHTSDFVPCFRTVEPKGENHKAPEDDAGGLMSGDHGSGLIAKSNADNVNPLVNDGDMGLVNTEMGDGSTELKQCSEAASLVEDTDHSVGSSFSGDVNTNPEKNEPEELSREVTDKPATSKPEKDEQEEMSNDEVEQSGEVELKLSQDVPSPNGGSDVLDKAFEIHEPAGLPRETMDENRAANEIVKTEEVQVVEDDALQSGEEERQMALGATSEQDGTAIVDQSEQQRPEAKMEQQPIVQTGTWEKVGSTNDEGLSGDSVLPPQKEVNEDDLLPLVSESIESQPLSLPIETETNKFVCEDGPSDIIDVDAILADSERPMEEKVPIEGSTKDSEFQPAVAYVEDKLVQDSKFECEDNEDGLESVAEATKEDVFVDTQCTSVQKTESLTEKPGASSLDGCIVGDESDRKIIEENEKLKEMMQKLMEAGNQQLQFISNLTGRVKDLEKKLSKKKIVRTRRCRAASPSSNSCVKSSK